MFSKRFKITLPLFDRNHGDFKQLNKEFLKVWGEVPNILSTLTFDTKLGVATLNVNWDDNFITKIKKKLTDFYTLEDYVNGKIPEEKLKEINEYKHEYLELSCIISCDINNLEISETDVERIIFYYIENIISHIFLAMNLSTPGCFNWYSNELKTKSNLDIYRFSSSEFESAWIESIEEGWPLIERVELNKTWKWIKGLNLGYKQISENSIERVLYSILIICQENRVSPNMLVWNAHALESLYGKPKYQISKTLWRRISLFLELPDNEQEYFTNRFREFYSLRSRFVHGELDISHPLENNVLDHRIFDKEGYILDNVGFSFCIIIATLQKMIKSDLKTLKF